MTIKTFSSTPGADNSLGLVKDIRAEFGGTAGLAPDGRIKQAKISQYYRNGFFVPNLGQNAAIPTSGQVQFSNYFGTRTASAPPQLTFTNSSFEDSLNGWTVLNTGLLLNGGSTILGFPTPTDTTPTPFGGPGQVLRSGGQNTTSSTSYQAPGGGARAALLSTGTYNVPNGAIIYGPAIYSNNPVYVVAGTKLRFYWRGINGPDAGTGDAFSAFGYMLNPLTGATIELLNSTSSSQNNPEVWTPVDITFTEPQSGIYHFVFIAGSFDATFGTVVGSALAIDNIFIDNTVLETGTV